MKRPLALTYLCLVFPQFVVHFKQKNVNMIQTSIHKVASLLEFSMFDYIPFAKEEEKNPIQLEVNNLVEHNIQNICESFLVEATTSVDGNY